MTGTTSYWSAAADMPSFPKISSDLDVDVVVIGAGITGLTAAYLLKREGQRVAVVERRQCSGVDTWSTTAHLTCVTDTPLSSLVKAFGEDHARAVWDAGLAAIAQIAECVRREKIDCDFAWVPGYLHAPAMTEPGVRPESAAEFLREEAALAAELGFDARFVDQVPFVHRPGIEIDGQARFHPLKYLAALARVVDGGGSFIFEHSAAEEVSKDPLTVTAGGHTLRCKWVVEATHNPIAGAASIVAATFLQTKLALYSSYAIGGRIPPGRVPDALFWDTGDPYHYLRIDPQEGSDFVIFGGEDHKTGQVADTRVCFDRLETDLARLLPDVEVTHRWSGQVIESNDGLPLIGEMAPHQFAATGYSGNGMTFGTLAAIMARDAVSGAANPWRALFDIQRTKIVGGLWDYLKENKDYPYYMMRDRFAGAEGRSFRGLRRNSGKILDIKGTRVAAYRDGDGHVTTLSPICTHMGCRVQWNSVEETWDCPCHGSRFSATGEVMSGPAEKPLEKVQTTTTSG